jgi:hypothetical protein
LGALYVVGKICYEAGKDVAEVERQLREERPEELGNQHVEQIKMDLYAGGEKIDEICEEAKSEMTEAIDESLENNTKPTTMLGRAINKVKNAKLFLTAKKAFDKSGKKPGILSSLLTNPDGARIEAVVRDGGVQISVKPRAA